MGGTRGRSVDGAGGSELSRDVRFSVVVPAHDAAATLGPCVRSVLAQTVPEFELIVVDDGSTDATLDLARSFTDPRVQVISRRAGGVSAARNVGIDAATGEIVAFLDSDDLLLPRYLEAVGAVFSADPAVDFVYTDAWTFDDRSRRVRKHTTAYYQRPPRPAPPTARGLLRELLLRNFIIVPVAVRRAVLNSVGVFDTTMRGAEDWDLWVRLLVAGHRAAEAAGPLGLRRQHDAQASLDPMRMVAGHIRMLEKLLENPALSAEDEPVVRERLAAAHRTRRIVSGEDRRGAARLRLRHRLGRLRRAVGLGARWYRTPPPPVTAAFGDLADLG